MATDLREYARSRMRHAGSAVLSIHNPFFTPIDFIGKRSQRDGRRLVSFSNYDYLGLMDHPAIIEAAQLAVAQLGSGVAASRLVGGERTLHTELEVELARFVGAEKTLALVSGYLTNVTLIGHLLGPRDLIICDEFSHSSMWSGAQMSKAHKVSFSHNDMDDLDRILTEMRPLHKRCLVMVESLYSMEGDFVDLPRLIEVKNRHDAWLLVDEAHSIGVMGVNGRGICEHFAVNPGEIDLIVGTLSKAFVSCGGFIAASADVIEWLKYTLPGFVFSVGLPPASAAASLTAVRLARAEPERVRRLQANSAAFLEIAQQLGVETGSAVGRGIVPVMVPTPQAAFLTSMMLEKAGIFVAPIVQTGIPKDKPRLRFFISASHQVADIERALTVVAEVTESMAEMPVAMPAAE